MRIFNSICNFINPNSDVNLEHDIKFYKKHVVFYNRFTAELEDLESSITHSTGRRRKKLKIKFKNILKKIYLELDDEAKQDIYDRAW